MNTGTAGAQSPGHTRHAAGEPSEIDRIIASIKHYLPAQGPLKDFVHHNPLHAFQHLPFDEARATASAIFGYRVSMGLSKFRALFAEGEISEVILEKVIVTEKGAGNLKAWKDKLLYTDYRETYQPRIGQLRAQWKSAFKIDLDAMVHPTLFRILSSYLDQGIALWRFPVHNRGFLASVTELERNSFTSFFRTSHVKKWLLAGNTRVEELLEILVGDPTLYERYLFDQQFAHQGWSGMVNVVEDHPHTLLDYKQISLRDVIILELLLELDALLYLFGEDIRPLASELSKPPVKLFDTVVLTEQQEALALWQKAFEWSYYDQVLAAIENTEPSSNASTEKSFQALFCIDDRSSSLRRYLELADARCETFGTPGHFNVEFYFKPEHGKFYTKLCPATVKPEVLIREQGGRKKHERALHFTKRSHTLLAGWIISQTIGFWSAVRLFIQIFLPSGSPATASSFNYMDKVARLTLENRHGHTENRLRVGFTIEEMTNCVEELLKSIGLVSEFASLVYVVGHGSSSVNNPHYAAYDCGACSGRPGSVNARVICYMANRSEVRDHLAARGIHIPEHTQFVGALHDTTRDEIVYYDEDSLTRENQKRHRDNARTFIRAMKQNAKERSRRFASINTRGEIEDIHDRVKRRSVSLFEPRPEYNHATNAICVVGRRSLTRDLFLDRRAFLNSYDYRIDPDGHYLSMILKSAASVCGGINLEYFFSRVDNQKLGAGSKLPHNVVGLFAVANGVDGDLRPGLPGQMVEIHDPVRLMVVIEHYPDIVRTAVMRNPETYEWFSNEWIHLVALSPDTRKYSIFRRGGFFPYSTSSIIRYSSNVDELVETFEGNIPVHIIT